MYFSYTRINKPMIEIHYTFWTLSIKLIWNYIVKQVWNTSHIIPDIFSKQKPVTSIYFTTEIQKNKML